MELYEVLIRKNGVWQVVQKGLDQVEAKYLAEQIKGFSQPEEIETEHQPGREV